MRKILFERGCVFAQRKRKMQKRSTLAFDNAPITHLSCKNTLEFTLTNMQVCETTVKTLKEDGDCETDIILSFTPALTLQHAMQAHVRLLRLKDNCIIFSQYVFPSNEKPEYLEIHEEELNYVLFPAHQLHVDRINETVTKLFISLVDRTTDMRELSVLEPMVDVHANAQLFPPAQYKFLNWFPCNVDPAMYGLRIDPRTIPQRTPLWFKLRGEVTGTKAYTLLGFWVPTKSQDPNWSFFKPGTFTPFAKAAMRLGSLSEDAALLTYFSHFKDRAYEEVGWCGAPSPLPKSWGASPDGIVTIPPAPLGPGGLAPFQSVDDTLGNFSHANSPPPKAGANSRGALEIKTSRTKLSMEAYFYPQIYMEMIVLNVQWTDLIRYQPGTGANIYHVKRDPKIEEELIRLWKYAFAKADRLQEIVLEPDFKRMRVFFEQEARNAESVIFIPEPSNVIHSYNAYKSKLLQPVPPPPNLCSDPTEALVQNALRIQKSVKNKRHKADVAKLLVEQIEECGKLLKETL